MLSSAQEFEDLLCVSLLGSFAGLCENLEIDFILTHQTVMRQRVLCL